MTRKLVIIGAGGFGRETLDVVEAANRAAPEPVFDVVGVVDDSPDPIAIQRLDDRGVAWIGDISGWLNNDDGAQYLLAIGNPRVRQSIDMRLVAAGRITASVIHPTAGIGSASIISPGAIICSGAEVSTNVAIGRSAHINPNATIGHDAKVSDFVSINPGAIVSGEVLIGERSLVGAGAVILQGLKIGPDSVIGAAACVTRDVRRGSTVKGVPAR